MNLLEKVIETFSSFDYRQQECLDRRNNVMEVILPAFSGILLDVDDILFCVFGRCFFIFFCGYLI